MMNKDEAVQKLATAGRLSIAHAEDLYDSLFHKTVVTQYVADWYEKHKDNLKISICQTVLSGGRIASTTDFSTFELWFCEVPNSIQTLVNMHQFGYEVREEPRYAVRIKGIKVDKGFLNYDKFSNTWSFEDDDTGIDRFRAIHTRKELEDADFGWVFDCEGIEIEEVE